MVETSHFHEAKSMVHEVPSHHHSLSMKKNMSTLDRIIRLALAAGLLSMYYVSYTMYSELNPEGWGLVFFILGCALTVTSIFGFCPVYAPFGLCSVKNESASD